MSIIQRFFAEQLVSTPPSGRTYRLTEPDTSTEPASFRVEPDDFNSDEAPVRVASLDEFVTAVYNFEAFLS